MSTLEYITDDLAQLRQRLYRIIISEIDTKEIIYLKHERFVGDDAMLYLTRMANDGYGIMTDMHFLPLFSDELSTEDLIWLASEITIKGTI